MSIFNIKQSFILYKHLAIFTRLCLFVNTCIPRNCVAHFARACSDKFPTCWRCWININEYVYDIQYIVHNFQYIYRVYQKKLNRFEIALNFAKQLFVSCFWYIWLLWVLIMSNNEKNFANTNFVNQGGVSFPTN
jgi:hypothetical protein